jgi:hypothetical protein
LPRPFRFKVPGQAISLYKFLQRCAGKTVCEAETTLGQAGCRLPLTRQHRRPHIDIGSLVSSWHKAEKFGSATTSETRAYGEFVPLPGFRRRYHKTGVIP